MPTLTAAMTRFLVRLVTAVFAVLVLSFVPMGTAWARSLQIVDEGRVLSAADAGRLRSTVAGAPFDGQLVVTGRYADAEELSRFVGSLVREPDVVVVGLDPVHRHVEVHFGTGTRIPRSAWPAIERAGNDAFRQGRWEEGAAAIFETAARSVDPAAATLPEGSAAAPARRGFGGAGLLGVLLVGGLVVAVLAFVARRRPLGPGGYGDGPPPGPYGGYGAGYGPGMGVPGYGPGYPPAGGMGAVGGGLLGAGLGGVAGYELGKLEAEREERDRDARDIQGAGLSGADGNDDAGGGGSSWGDDDANGPNDDGGGGGGFDGGGGDGGDFGGGGGDY